MIRQNLVCNADAGIITYNWVKDHSTPYPNFNTLHKCRNFDSLMGYAKSIPIPVPAGYQLAPQVGDKVWEHAP